MLPTTQRQGRYFRVYSPEWTDPPNETTYNKKYGGRWNLPDVFGALYLNATIAVAAAQARHQHAGRAIKLFDLQPQSRPVLAAFDVLPMTIVDAVSAVGIKSLKLPTHFPYGVDWTRCQAIGIRAHRAALSGVAARSNAEATLDRFVGEELVSFDSQPMPAMTRFGIPFAEWYPDPIPG